MYVWIYIIYQTYHGNSVCCNGPDNITTYYKTVWNWQITDTKLDLRYKPDYFKGLSVGYTGFDYGDTTKNSVSVGYEYRKEIDDKWSFTYMLDGYVAKTSVANNRIDYENYLEFKYKFSDKLSLTNLFDYNNFRGIEFYKMKIGVEYEIWKSWVSTH